MLDDALTGSDCRSEAPTAGGRSSCSLFRGVVPVGETGRTRANHLLIFGPGRATSNSGPGWTARQSTPTGPTIPWSIILDPVAITDDDQLFRFGDPPHTYSISKRIDGVLQNEETGDAIRLRSDR